MVEQNDDDLVSAIFNIDYSDLPRVIALAKRMGSGHLVVKYPERPNYNITHASREYELRGDVRVIHRT